MTDGFGRVPVAAEMDIFERKISGDCNLFAGSWAKQGAIVANSQAQFSISSLLAATQGCDKRQLPAGAE